MSASLKSSLSAAGALRLSRRNGRAVSCSGTIATAAGAVCVRVSDRTERLRCHVADGRGGLEAVVRFVPRVSVEVLLPCLTAAGKSWTALADADVLAGDLGLPDPGACLLLGWLAAAEWVERVANAAAADRTAAPADWDRRRALRPVAADRAPERDERPDWDLIRWPAFPGSLGRFKNRGQALHAALGAMGYPSATHSGVASRILGRPVASLSGLTADEDARVRAAAVPAPSTNEGRGVRFLLAA